MTVDTEANTKTYTGDNLTTEFSFPYLVYQSSHMTITLDGVSTSAWSATGYGDAAGITVTFDSAPGTGVSVVMQRIVPYTQETDLENFDGNPSDVSEKQFDLLAMADQQLDEKVARAILAPIGTSLTTNVISGTIDSTARVISITTAGPAASTLSDLSSDLDVVLTGSASGDFLKYDGASWVNRTAAEVRSDLSLVPGTNVQAYDTELAALSGVTSAADKVPYFTGSGTASVSDFGSFGRSSVGITGTLPLGHGGLVTSLDTDTDHDINVTAGHAIATVAAGGYKVLELSSELTKQIDATWSSGDDAGGLSSSLSAPANSTTYHVFLIEVGGSVDVGFDTSLTAANLIADHSATAYRRIASLNTDGSANWVGYVQVGNMFLLDVPVTDVSASNPGTSAVLASLSVPSGISVMAGVNVDFIDTSAAAQTNLLLTSPLVTDTAASGVWQMRTSVGYALQDGFIELMTDTSAQVRYRLSASTADHTVKLITNYWKDLFAN